MKLSLRYIFITVFTLTICLASCRKTYLCNEENPKTLSLSPGPFHTVVCGKYTKTRIIPTNQYKVELVAGEKLLDNVKIKLKDSILYISLNAYCLLRDSARALHVNIFAPNLKTIRNASAFEVYSTEYLPFEYLKLISENYSEPEALNSGNFKLKINNRQLDIIANGSSTFYVEGNTQKLFIGFYGNMPRFEGTRLTVSELEVHHNSANDILIKPLHSAKGDLYSTGDLILYHHPAVMEIRTHYTGKVIFR